jgi:hypothetical protein
MTKRFSILLILLSTVIQTKAQNWTTYYGPYGSEVTQWALSFIEKDNGSIVFCGMSDTLLNEDGFISEIDSNGSILKEIYIGGTYYDRLIDIFPNDSGYISLGFQEDYLNYAYSMYSYVQLDSNLNVMKEYFDTVPTVDKKYSDFCSDNNSIYGVRSNATTLFLVKFDMYGNEIWEMSYNYFSAPRFGRIITTNDGNLLLSGIVDYNQTSSNEAYLLKLDTSGNTIWQNTLSGPNSRFMGRLSATVDSGAVFILFDDYDWVNYTGGEFRLVEYDKYGNETLNIASHDSSAWYHMEKTTQGYLLGGYVYDDQGFATSAIGKVGFNEVLMPIDTFNYANYSRIYNIIHLEHSQGTLLVGGYKSDSWHAENLFISKIQNNEITWTTFINEQPLDRKIEITCYPNPTQNYINISFNNNGSIQNSIIISDLNGKIIYHKSINAEELVLDVSKYPSGAYIISVNNRKEKGQSLFIKK